MEGKKNRKAREKQRGREGRKGKEKEKRKRGKEKRIQWGRMYFLLWSNVCSSMYVLKPQFQCGGIWRHRLWKTMRFT